MVDPASRGDMHEAWDMGDDSQVLKEGQTGNLWPPAEDLPDFKPTIQKAWCVPVPCLVLESGVLTCLCAGMRSWRWDNGSSLFSRSLSTCSSFSSPPLFLPTPERAHPVPLPPRWCPLVSLVAAFVLIARSSS